MRIRIRNTGYKRTQWLENSVKQRKVNNQNQRFSSDLDPGKQNEKYQAVLYLSLTFYIERAYGFSWSLEILHEGKQCSGSKHGRPVNKMAFRIRICNSESDPDPQFSIGSGSLLFYQRLDET
jgi:hypothetical protein